MIIIRSNNEHFPILGLMVLGVIVLAFVAFIGLIDSEWEYVLYLTAIWVSFAFLDMVTREYRFDGHKLQQVRSLCICSKFVLRIPTRTIESESIKNVKIAPSKFYGLIDDQALFVEYDNKVMKISTDFTGTQDLYEVLREMVEQRPFTASTS